ALALGQTLRPAARCSRSWSATSARARRRFGVTTIVPAANARLSESVRKGIARLKDRCADRGALKARPSSRGERMRIAFGARNLQTLTAFGNPAEPPRSAAADHAATGRN